MRLLQLDRMRAGATQPEHSVPVVEHRPLVARDRNQHQLGVVREPPLSVREFRAGDEVGRVGRTGAVVPRAVDDVAVANRRYRPRRQITRGSNEVAVGAKELALSGFREEGRDLDDVRGPEAEAPTGRGAAAAELHDDPVERLDSELVPAEAPRLQDSIEASLDERVVRRLRIERALLGRLLISAQLLAHRGRPVNELVRFKARLRHRQDRMLGRYGHVSPAPGNRHGGEYERERACRQYRLCQKL